MQAVVLIAFAVLAASPHGARAQGPDDAEDTDFRIGSRLNLVASGKENVWAAGAQVTVVGDAGNDIFVVGGSAEIDSETGGDLSVIAGTVDVRGAVGQDAWVTGATIDFNAAVDHDFRATGATVKVRKDTHIGGKASVLGASVDFRGTVEGAATIIGDEVIFAGVANGPIILQGRSVRIARDARIISNVTVRSSNEPVVDDPLSVAGKVILEDARKEPAAGWDWGFFTGISLAFAVSAFVVGATFMLLSPAILKTATGTVRSRPALAFINGMVAAIGGPILAIVLILILVTAPLGIFLFMAFPILALAGHGVVGHVLGETVIGWLNIGERTLYRLVFLAVGVLVVSLIGLIPYAGPFLALLLLIVGVGAILLALAEHLFGRAAPAAG